MYKPTLLCIGSGPGIGRSVASLFATKHYKNVALIARRPEQLRIEKAAVQEAAGQSVNVQTYALDVTDTDALLSALNRIEEDLGRIECVFYNAARVQNSSFFEYDVKEIEYDFKYSMPRLVELANTPSQYKPALIVTSSMLPFEPMTDLFALSLVKAAQLNLVHSLAKVYKPQGVHVGVINVAGFVSEEEKERNPKNIADKTWEWFTSDVEDMPFEVRI
ncbi:hypothetical protein FSPOR_6436 [Fusarium sporotrichioides]|uniref:Uncharacterized protein n=1 Tax=Fusarium sporotrichioides TaxID=5514 RepID=A0A395S2R5_FUSSP|nr:hypothetical protein FSPOR_6436 [Fusarium sporotrichioides]